MKAGPLGLEIHRRPAAPEEAAYLADHCEALARSAQARGDTVRGAALIELGMRLCELFEAGGGDVLLFHGRTTDGEGTWDVFEAIPVGSHARGGLGVGLVYRCPDSCTCRGLPLVPFRLKFDMGSGLLLPAGASESPWLPRAPRG